MDNVNDKKFELGDLVATPGAMESFTDDQRVECLKRHAAGDWGDLDEEDRQTNDAAVVEGDRLLSAYVIDGQKLWIITEADRAVTTFLLPSEY